jgi:hypothetical protein
MGVVGRAGVAPARVAPTAFEAAVSAVPPPTRMGPPAGSAPALRGYKPRALLVTPGRRCTAAGLRRDCTHPGFHRISLLRSDTAYCSGGRLGGSRTLTPSRAPTPRAGASAVPPRAVVVPSAGSAPATSGVSGRRSTWLSYVGIGLPGRTRTCGLPLRRRALYRLSYWELVGRAGLEPASGSVKESCPWPLDERPRES